MVRRRRAFPLMVAIAIALQACGSSVSPSPTVTPTTTTSAPTEQLSIAPVSTETSAVPSATLPATAWHPDPSCNSTDPVVQQAIAYVEAHTQAQTDWYGPTTSYPPTPGVKVALIPLDVNNTASLLYMQDVANVAKKIGWDATMIDAKGTTEGATAAFTQAMALNVKVIITSVDVVSVSSEIAQAKAMGIQVLAWHAATLPGPDLNLGVGSIVAVDSADAGMAEAEYAIADSCGTAKVIAEYDSAYAYSQRKILQGAVPTIQACKTCTLLEVVNSPLAELPTRQPQLCSNWAAKYGKGWYGIAVYDGVWDFCVPALQTAGLGPTDVHLIATDGVASAYQRMSQNQFQVATIPEPVELQAYAIVDDAIRLLAGQPAVWGYGAGEWHQPVFIAFGDGSHGNNLSIEGGDKQGFFPSDDYANRYLKMWGIQS